jgi:hypothetical protein
MSRLEHNGEDWRKRAEELALMALRVSDQNVRLAMLQLAAAYERLARFVRHRSSTVDPGSGDKADCRGFLHEIEQVDRKLRQHGKRAAT